MAREVQDSGTRKTNLKQIPAVQEEGEEGKGKQKTQNMTSCRKSWSEPTLHQSDVKKGGEL